VSRPERPPDDTAARHESPDPGSAKARILVVDDEEIVVRSVQRILAGGEYVVDAAANGADAMRAVAEHPYDVVVLDIMMPGTDGIEVLQRIKVARPATEVIMFTGLAQVETAVKSMKLGAFDYIAKPFEPDELRLAVRRALERRWQARDDVEVAAEAPAAVVDGIVGASSRMREVFQLVAQCAGTNTTVLITGESGTGKELIAHAIHRGGPRRDKPFVAVDCNALSENLLESELFGHVKGSFTGAVANKKGMIEAADGGTLFLDEISNISMSTQAKLLRVIQEREFRAVGDTRTQTADFRLVAASNRDLKAMVAAGTFRDDLFYRLNVFPIVSPPLRERREDIPALAIHFLCKFAVELGKPVNKISEGAMSLLSSYAWPGNVRELESAIQRALVLAGGDTIRRVHLGAILEGAGAVDVVPATADDLKRAKKALRERSVEPIEKAFVMEALKRNGWSVTRSAQATGMLRSNFQALMRKYSIRVRDGQSEEPEEPEA
jgi:DNA-binding NtrC family response regulator